MGFELPLREVTVQRKRPGSNGSGSIRSMSSNPQYERNRPPQNRGFDLHNRDDGPATGRMSGSALLIAMAIVTVAVVAVVVFVFLR